MAMASSFSLFVSGGNPKSAVSAGFIHAISFHGLFMVFELC
jgi:hypothetical protein